MEPTLGDHMKPRYRVYTLAQAEKYLRVLVCNENRACFAERDRAQIQPLGPDFGIEVGATAKQVLVIDRNDVRRLGLNLA